MLFRSAHEPALRARLNRARAEQSFEEWGEIYHSSAGGTNSPVGERGFDRRKCGLSFGPISYATLLRYHPRASATVLRTHFIMHVEEIGCVRRRARRWGRAATVSAHGRWAFMGLIGSCSGEARSTLGKVLSLAIARNSASAVPSLRIRM